VNEAAALVMLALIAVAAWAVLGPYQRGRAAAPEQAADPLEDERRRALRHLRDLDEDRSRGKLDEESYLAARAGAEARAVAVLRALEVRERTGELTAGLREVRNSAPCPPARGAAADGRGRRWWRLAVACAAATAVVVGAAALLTGAVGNRDDGQTITGQGIAPSQAGTTLEAFEQRVREHPRDIAARLDLGQRYLDAGRLREATGEYLAALKLDPGNAEASTNLALLLFQAGLAEQALRSVDNALATDPRYPEALYAKGIIQFMGLRQAKAAAATFRAYLEVAPFGAHRDVVEQLLQLATAGAAPGASPARTPGAGKTPAPASPRPQTGFPP
jgi:cytochrome c-type biogenesis protein CcmH/NrfG